MDYYDVYPDMTPEEEAKYDLEAKLDAVRWPIEDDVYLESLDEQAGAA
jgi:hypothetical protein